MTGSAGSASPKEGSRDAEVPILRAKYLDYCSARVAEALLALTPDEIFLLAQDSVRSGEEEPAPPLSYDEMVQIATGRISRKLALPSFDLWVEAYRADPTRFDREMLGLWESDVGED